MRILGWEIIIRRVKRPKRKSAGTTGTIFENDLNPFPSRRSTSETILKQRESTSTRRIYNGSLRSFVLLALATGSETINDVYESLDGGERYTHQRISTCLHNAKHDGLTTQDNDTWSLTERGRDYLRHEKLQGERKVT